jgi:hypothetical protein
MADDTHALSPDAARPAWRVKHDGNCSRCGVLLRQGEVAVWERPTKTIRCVECPTALVEEEPRDEPIEQEADVGVAGGSAMREYERRKEKREAAIRQRFGQRLGGLVLALTDDPQSTRAWRSGAIGEEKLANAIVEVDGVSILNDRRVPGSRANIDHIIVAPAGVFVVDAKNYRGLIRIRDRGGLFRSDHRLYVGRQDCSKLADGLTWQLEAVVSALQSAGVDPLPSVTPVLCFVAGEWPLLFPPSEYKGVRLEGTKSLRQLLVASDALDQASIHNLTTVLAAALPHK